MSRAEKKYLWVEDIIAWGHGKYSRSALEKMAVPELFNVHSDVYYQHIVEINTIHN